MDAELSSTERSLLDLSQSPKVEILLDMVARLSQAATAADVLTTFSSGMQKLDAPSGYISLSTRGVAPGQYRITRFLADDGFATLGDIDTWSTREELPICSGGVLGDIVSRGTPAVYGNLHVADDVVLGDRLSSYRSMMAIPLYDKGEILNWAIPLRREPHGFTLAHLEEGLLRSNLVGGTVRHVQTTQELLEVHERMQFEVKRIAAIQRALLPELLPNIQGVSVAVSFDTCDEAGGDLYDVRQVPGMRGNNEPAWGFFIGDASGHGPSAAVVMAMLHAILATCLETADSPGAFIAKANRQLCNKRIEQSFVTAILGMYLEQSRRFVYCRAGHNPALLLRDGKTSVLDAVGDFPLGIESDEVYATATVQLQHGDVLVMYTDGWVEARSPDDEEFGECRLRDYLEHMKHTEPQHVIQTLEEALWAHQQSKKGGDDQTLLVWRVED